MSDFWNASRGGAVFHVETESPEERWCAMQREQNEKEMSAMTYQTISDLLADPVLGKLPEVREWAESLPDIEYGLKDPDLADAAILAVAKEFAEFKSHHYGGGCGCDAALPYEREGS